MKEFRNFSSGDDGRAYICEKICAFSSPELNDHRHRQASRSFFIPSTDVGFF